MGSTMRLPCHVAGRDIEDGKAMVVWFRNRRLYKKGDMTTYDWWQHEVIWDQGHVTVYDTHGEKQSRFSLEREGNVRKLRLRSR